MPSMSLDGVNGSPLFAAAVGAAGVAAYYSLNSLYSRLNAKDVTGQVVLITGAGSGIGRLMALNLAKDGCKLVLWDVNEEGCKKVVEEIKALGAEAKQYGKIDVTNREKVYETAKEVLKDFGRVDILINNAGIVNGQKILECDDKRMELTMNVNAVSHFWTIKAFLPQMIERKSGHIVSIASMAGIVGTAGLVDYSGSKYAAIGIIDALQAEMVHNGYKDIHCLCVCPFFIKTGMFEGAKSKYEFLFPILEPQYVADKVVLAIKQKQSVLLMPRTMYITPILKACLPTSAVFAIMAFLESNSAMDNFVQTRK